MKLSLIVAMDRNGLIGKDGGLPWGRIPEDMRLFRELTELRPVIMGRKTFKAIGGRLLYRANVVMTHYACYQAPGAHVVGDVDSAVSAAKEYVVDWHARFSSVFVIGGAQVYAAFRDLVTEAHVTLIDGEYAGDTYFPFPLLGSPDWKPLAEPRTLAPGVVYHHLGRV